MKKRLAVLLLALCLLITCFACAKKDGDKDSTGDGSSTSTEKGELPVIDYNGKDFRISGRLNNVNIEILCDDETSTEICDVALMNRNAAVEDAYDIRIVCDNPSANDGDSQVNYLATVLASGDDEFDLMMTYVYKTATLIMEDYALNWKNFKYTDLTASYWQDNINEKFAIKDAIYATVSDMCTSVITNTIGMFYNRTQGENWQQGLSKTVFDTIRSGDWTYDYFYNLVNGVNKDIDEETGLGENDFYGFMTENNTHVDVYHYAWDIPTISNDPETGLTDTFYSEKLVNAVQKVYNLYFNNTGVFYTNSQYKTVGKFVKGNAMFATLPLNYCYSHLRDMEDTYTVLPYPKYDENQTDYLAGAIDNYSVMTVPFTVKDTDYVSLIVEALSKESEATLWPTFYQDALQAKYVSDPDTLEMIKYLLDGVNFDISYLVKAANIKSASIFRLCIKAQSTDIAAQYGTYKDSIAAGLRDIMTKYESNSNK